MKLLRRPTRVPTYARFLLTAGALLAVPRVANAEQFILFDATFEYTWEDATTSSPSLSHYYVNEGNFLNVERPDNWQTPVNYRDGTVHIRAEVLEKPAGDQAVGWALCYIANAGGYGCAYTDYYTQTGVFERDVGMHDWWNNDQIDWSQGIKQMDLVYTINDSGSGHVHNFPDKQTLTTPTKVRITLVQVSQGSTYDPSWLDTGNMGGTDGMAMGGSGGMAGSAGMSGSGGTGGSVGGTGGTAGSASMPIGGSAGSPAGTAGTGGTGMMPAAPRASQTSSGCSLSQAHVNSTAWLSVLALGALFGLRRRRR